MYFVKRGGTVCHVLGDTRTGAAPCGIKLSNLELSLYKAGKPTPQIIAGRPTGVPLCKHCQKRL
jgi:hypothetical protein